MIMQTPWDYVIIVIIYNNINIENRMPVKKLLALYEHRSKRIPTYVHKHIKFQLFYILLLFLT